MKNPNSSSERLRFVCRPYITSESNPRDARLTARRSNGSALYTLDQRFSKSRAQKVRAQTPMLTRPPDLSQGGLSIEDTGPPRPRVGRASAPPTPARHALARPTPPPLPPFPHYSLS